MLRFVSGLDTHGSASCPRDDAKGLYAAATTTGVFVFQPAPILHRKTSSYLVLLAVTLLVSLSMWSPLDLLYAYYPFMDCRSPRFAPH